jgi:hypothetical protein
MLKAKLEIFCFVLFDEILFLKKHFFKVSSCKKCFSLISRGRGKNVNNIHTFFWVKFLDFSLVFESFWLSLYCDISGVWRYEEICLLCSEKKGPKSIRLTGALGWRTRQVKLTDTLGWAVQWATVDSVTDDCHADRLAKAAWCAKLTGSQSWPARRVWIVFFLWTEEVHFYYSSIRSMEEIIFWGSVFFCFVVLRFFSSFLKS